MILRDSFNGLRKYRSHIICIFIFCMVTTMSFLAMHNMRKTSAADLSKFRPGNIISDAVMGNYTAMSINDIQNFLNSKNRCGNTNYNQYLQLKAAYPHLDWHFENGHFVCLSQERFGDGTHIGSGQTAAEIIYQAAQDYRINPQVILVLLQKEQGLITDDYPNTLQYRSATGFGCPDTAACSSEYYGFKNQVRQAAKMFRSVLDGGWSNYPAGKTSYIQYNPNRSCGGTNVYIENRATSALYRYTPYQPNSSALNAGYGSGDICGAYGNRNFYLYFSDWFGDTQTPTSGNKEAIIPDGTYGLVSKTNSNMALEIAGGITNVQIWDRNTSGYQFWKFQRDPSSNTYTITNTKTNQKLTTASSDPTKGTNVYTSNQNNCTTKWKIYETPDHYLMLESSCRPGLVLDNSGNNGWNGNNVQLWTEYQGDAVKWSIYTGKTIENGVYTISAKNNQNKMIDVAGGGRSNATNIQIWDNNSAGAQKWRVEYDSNSDFYTLTNPDSNKRLDLSGENTKIGTNVHLWEPVNACSQKWKIINVGDSYTLLSACSPSRALDLAAGSTNNMTNIQSWEVNNANAQKWQFHDQRILTDGNYTIYSKADRKYAVDIVGGLNYDGVNVNLYQANSVPEAQLWYLRYNASNGDYTLLNTSKQRSLDLAGGASYNGNDVRIWSNNLTCAQRWSINKNSDNSYTLISTCDCHYALDLAGGRTFNTNDIQLWGTNGADAQKWYFDKK